MRPELLQALADGFEPVELESLEEVVVGIAWLEQADPLVHARVREAAALFPRSRELDFPFPREIGVVFMREVADVHRDLFAEFDDSYGENVRTKIERCLEVTEADYERGVQARAEYTARAQAALEGINLLLTPTLGSVAPLPVDDLEIRERAVRLTLPFNALGWPALALPCGPAEDGLPASAQIAGPAGSDAIVLAAGPPSGKRSLTRSRDARLSHFLPKTLLLCPARLLVLPFFAVLALGVYAPAASAAKPLAARRA